MKQSTFWNDASRCGAVIGLVNIALAALSMLFPKLSFVLGLVATVVTIYLLFYYTRRRASLFSQEGFSYGQALGFMLASGLFTGILVGAYQIVAVTWLFPEQFEAAYEQVLVALSQFGAQSVDMDEMSKMYHALYFSPLPVLFSNVLGNVIQQGFFGLFIAIGVKREPNLFDSEVDDEE